jgi:hypothetical protein
MRQAAPAPRILAISSAFAYPHILVRTRQPDISLPWRAVGQEAGARELNPHARSNDRVFAVENTLASARLYAAPLKGDPRIRTPQAIPR